MRVPVDAEPEAEPADALPVAPANWRQMLRPLAGPFVLDSATSLVSGAISVLTVVIAIDVLSAGEAGTGYLNAATGVGGVLAGVAGGALLARRLEVPLIIGGVLGGVGLAWLAVSGDLVVAMIAIGVAIAGVLLLDIVNTTLIQRTVPDELRGRAMGALQTSSAILYSLGSLVGPILADVAGMGTVLLGSAALTALGVVVALLLGRAPASVPPVDPVRLRSLEQPIFAGLPAARLETAARRLALVGVPEGETVIRQGAQADRFYVVDAGSFRVTQHDGGAEVELRRLGPGDVFGEIGLLRGIPRTASVTALTDGVLHALDAEAFAELVGSGPGLGSRLLDLYRGALTR
jgi:MFS family permease